MIILFQILLKYIFSRKTGQILVVFQNNYELRGGGGFITQLLDISIGKGRIKMNFRHDYQDLQGTATIKPPATVKKYLGLNHWYLRDSNLFGDFAENAKSIGYNYSSIYKNQPVVAVFAVNFTLIEQIMSIVGNIKLNAQTLDSQNIFSVLTDAVSSVDRHDLNALNNRKNLLKELFHDLSGKIFLSPWKWPALARLFKESLKTKDFQIHFFELSVQKKLIAKELIETFSSNKSTDCLAIVENNFLGLKTNRYLRRLVFHDVQFFFDSKNKRLSDAIINVKIRTEHFGSFNYPLSGTYQSVTSVFIPKLAQNLKILSTGINFDTNKTKDFLNLTYHQLLAVGQSSEITFQYSLPAKLFLDCQYTFRYIKQSGVQNEHIFETVNYPDQYKLQANNDQLLVRESKLFVNHDNLDRSYDYAVNGKFHHQSPRIFFHEIISPSVIQIRFNEPVFFKNSTQTSRNIKVVEKQTGDGIPVKSLKFTTDNRHLLIDVPTLPQENERFYHVLLSNIQNYAGVSLDNAPKKVTVVYRPKFFQH